MVTSFATPWLKPIQEYGNPNLENFHKGVKEGGHWVARKRSGGGTDEAPKREFIQTIAQQRAYCREEGLIPPDDCSSVPMSIKSDGKAVNNSCGETGCWV
jgi:hypothetical protein